MRHAVALQPQGAGKDTGALRAAVALSRTRLSWWCLALGRAPGLLLQLHRVRVGDPVGVDEQVAAQPRGSGPRRRGRSGGRAFRLGEWGSLGGRWVHGLRRGGPRMGWPRGQQQHLEQQLGAVRGTEVKIATSWGKCPYPICTNDLPALQGKSLTPGQTALVQSSFFQGHLQLSVAYPGSNLPLPLGSPSSHQTRPEGIISPLPTGANQSQVYFLSLQLFGLIYPTTWALQGLFLFWQLQLRLHPLPRTTTADPSLALGAPQICIPTRHPVSLPHLWIHPCPLHFLLRYISRTPLTQFPTFHTGLLYPVSTLIAPQGLPILASLPSPSSGFHVCVGRTLSP